MLKTALFFAQNYPTDYFTNPMDIPAVLSGNFGELRDNHFHSGLDYKTQQKVGIPVFAPNDGYIARIKIAQYGYGKAIYIAHPNGYTSVYGHLNNFSPELEKYIKKIQYEKKNFEVEIFPKPNELPLKKGEVFAYSGNTGSSGGPHLHFEIRDSETQFAINPLLFGLKVPDNVKPMIQYLFVYPLDENAQANQWNDPTQVNLKLDSLNIYQSDSVFAFGRIGFAVNTYDQQSGDVNQNGIYSMKLLVNNKPYFQHQLDKFSFDESKFINLHIDYEYYEKKNTRLQKCFIEPFNLLSTYNKNFTENGFINVQENDTLQVEILVGDIDNNISTIRIPLIGKKFENVNSKPKEVFNYTAKSNEALNVNLDSIKIYFPKNTFYNTNQLNITKNADGSVQVHEDIIPLNKTFNITFDVSKLDDNTQKHSYVAKIGYKGSTSYITSELKDNQLVGKAKVLGKYGIKQDFKAPTINALNFEKDKWITNEKVLQVKISDDLSGIKSYKATLNGRWILMERNHNTGVLTYDFNDITFEDTKFVFNLSVTDNANNTKTFDTTFYRAKP